MPDGFPNRGPAVLAVTVTTFVLGSLFVLARTVCRVAIVRRFGWDDLFIVLAWLVALGLSLTITLGVRNGLGRHDADIAAGKMGQLRMCEYVFSILYNPALMATKTSILIFYLRLSKNTQATLRWGSYFILVVGNIAGTVLTFLNIFQCRPLRAAFSTSTATTSTARCIPLLTEFICSAPINIITDLAILSLPIPVLTGMRLPSRQKTILVFTFALGIFVTVVDVVRVYYLQQAINTVSAGASSTSSIFGEGAEFSWNASLSLMWSAVEVNIGIACACIPTLKPLIIKFIPAMLIDPDGSRLSSSYARDPESSDPAPLPPLSREPELASNGIAASDHAQLSVNGVRVDPEPTPLSPSARVAAGTRRVITGMTGAVRFTEKEEGTSGQQQRQRRQRKKKDKSVYFGFVKLHAPKNMLKATASQSLRYCTMVAVLFFLWGFSYGLLNTLNNVVAEVADMTTTQTLGLTSAYFGGGYLFGPLVVGEWILRHDEHHRRRSSSGSSGSGSRSGSGSGSAHRKSHDPDVRHSRSTVQSIPAAAVSVVSAAATTVTRRSSTSSSVEAVGGFKATFIVGLCFYGTGTIMFWPSAVLTSFPGFLISNFVVGFGLSILETAANPFIALCGPLEYAEVRLLVVQGAQGIGSVLSGLLAQHVFFGNLSTSSSSTSSTTPLLDVQWTYLAITLLCAALAMFFYYVPLPELPDAELAQAAGRLPVDGTKKTVLGLQLRTVCLWMAVVAQWTYVASQESMSIYFYYLMSSWLPKSSSEAKRRSLLPTVLHHPPATSIAMSVTSISLGNTADDHPAGLAVSVPNYMLVCRTAFAVSRLCAALVVYLGVRRPHSRWLPSPRAVLLAASALMVLFALLLVVLPPQHHAANLVIVPMCLFFFAEGPVFPLIFAMGLRGQGTRTKRAAAFITMGTSGPLFWPYVMYAILRAGGSIRTAFIVVVALMAVGALYPLYLTLSRDARMLTSVAPLDPTSAPPPQTTTTTGCGGGAQLSPSSSRPDPNELNDVGGLLRRPVPVR